jgi:hypothetical protein
VRAFFAIMAPAPAPLAEYKQTYKSIAKSGARTVARSMACGMMLLSTGNFCSTSRCLRHIRE